MKSPQNVLGGSPFYAASRTRGESIPLRRAAAELCRTQTKTGRVHALTPSCDGKTDHMVSRNSFDAVVLSVSSTISNIMPTTAAQPPVPHAAATHAGCAGHTLLVVVAEPHANDGTL